MPRRRMLLGILMESPLYWALDYDERIYLVKEIQGRPSFIRAMGGPPAGRVEPSFLGGWRHDAKPGEIL
jgi:hypothetical protein